MKNATKTATATINNNLTVQQFADIVAIATAKATAASLVQYYGIDATLPVHETAVILPEIDVDGPAKTTETAGITKVDKVKLGTDTLTFESVVSNAQDNRLKLHAFMFNKNGHCLVNGTKYTANFTSDNGRGKVSPGTLGAKSGDTVRFMRDSVQTYKWTAIVNSPEIDVDDIDDIDGPAVTKNVPTSSGPAKTESEDLSHYTIESLAKEFAPLAKAGFKAGRSNPKLQSAKMGLADDARTFLTTQENKRFKHIREAIGCGMKDAILALNKLVYVG